MIELKRCRWCHELIFDERDCFLRPRQIPRMPRSKETPMNDTDRINWLEANSDRLEDVRGRINNEGVTVREAIDWFVRRHPRHPHVDKNGTLWVPRPIQASTTNPYPDGCPECGIKHVDGPCYGGFDPDDDLGPDPAGDR